MSLILEALRKSEAERRRGQAPGLFTPDAAVLMPGHPRRPHWLYAAVAVAALALSAAGWWFVSSDRTQANAITAAPEPASPSAGHPAAVAPQDSVPASTTTTAIPASTPGNAASTGVATPVAQPARTASAATTSAPSTTPSTITATTVQPSTHQRPVSPDRPIAMPARDPGNSAASTTTSATASPPAAGASQGDEAPAVTLAVLPSSRRSQLPPLKLSMHVYNEDAARRFAIVDGQRITEGNQLGPATVRSIRRDGVLIELDGERYLLPRP